MIRAIYRLENADGFGPYNPGPRATDDQIDMRWTLKQNHCILDGHSPTSKHPCAPRDGLSFLLSDQSVVYGCPSLPVLHAWFESEWNDLLSMDYRVVRYTLDDATAHVYDSDSGKQVAFDPHRALEVSRVPV